MSEEEVTLIEQSRSPVPSVYFPVEVPRRNESSWMYPLFVILAVLLVQAFTVGMFVIIWHLVK
jgi:hypothetical protein